MGAPDTPWWHTFFDATYADRNLVEHQAEEADRAAAFIVERLDLAPGAVLLDQCCGIGRISLPLARRGVEVLGVDITPAYVERATAAAAAEDLPCRFECADAFEYVAPAPCDAAINWFTSFGYAPDDRQNLRMLQRVHDSLESGGRFAIETANIPRVLGDFRPAFVVRHERPEEAELITIVESRMLFDEGLMEMHWTFIDADGRRDERTITTRMFMPHELTALLRAAGFVEIELLGSLDGDPFERTSRRLIVLARKA